MAIVLTSKEESRLCSSCFLFFLGLGMVVGGVVAFVSSFNYAYSNTLTQFALSAQEWNAQGRTFLNHTEFTLTFKVINGSELPLPETQQTMAVSIEPEAIPEDAMKAAQYEPLKVVSDPADAVYSGVVFNYTDTPMLKVTALATTSYNGTTASSLITFPLQPIVTETRLYLAKTGMASEFKCKQTMHGLWRPSTKRCVTVRRMSGLCLQLEPSLNAAGELSWNIPHLGNYGCANRKEWSAPVYTKLALDSEVNSLGVAVPGVVDVTLRSSQDPFLSIAHSTDGTLELGLTETELRAFGAILVVMASVVCINPSCFALKLWRKYGPPSQSSKEGLDREFDGLGMSDGVMPMADAFPMSSDEDESLQYATRSRNKKSRRRSSPFTPM